MTTINVKNQYHHGDLRSSLLDTAALIMQQHGETALSMRRLAQEVGVSRTAPYHHFKDKDDLLCAIAEEGFRRWQEELQLGSDENIWQASEASIEEFITAYINFATRNSAYYDLMFAGKIWRSGALTETLKREAYQAFKRYVAIVRNWQEDQLVSSAVNPLRYTQVSWSALHGMSRLLIDGIYIDNDAIGQMHKTAAAMFWHQLKTE